jgi:hypothetical protein
VTTSGATCVGAAAGGGNPPEHTSDLTIQLSVPLRNHAEVVGFFEQVARDCDGLGLLGRFADRMDWREVVGELPAGMVFYSLPSLEDAQQTADQWADDVDWFAYEITFADRTPESEKSNPAQASQMALAFAREHGLAYFVTPGRPVTRQHAAALAQYADAYGLQAYGEQRGSPDTYVELVKDTSREIRAVNPDILLFVAVSTDQAEDDPEVTYDLITRLMGDIDGVFIRTSGEPESMEKARDLVGLLRGQ